MNNIVKSILIILSFFLFSCNREESKISEEKAGDRLFLQLDPSESGIDFNNQLTETDSLNILEYLYFYNGGGVAIGDINNDGLQDIFFTSNQEANRLYINTGNLKFLDISEKAGITGKSDWNTGVTMADVNADGFLDFYVLAVGGINGLKGRNELYINNGDTTFTEAAEFYGIDLENYGTSAAFFDYDNDGDLDLYVLNHAVHTDESFGYAELRNNRTESSGDKLFENRNGKFVDVSEKAGIFGGANAYGLGIATADINNDGYTDIFISNDFHEDDYLYINNGDGTFTEQLKQKMTQTSRFSMGSDIADINHDGYPDILSVDMLPEDETALKASIGDEDINILNLRMKYGYHRQFSRNMLQLNNNGKNFQEIALLSGIAATDWSWSPLFADYDMDGEKDLFISNGIIRRPNDLDYIKYISNTQIRDNSGNKSFIDTEALKMMPDGKVPNYFYQGTQNLEFRDVSSIWAKPENTASTGSAYGDLDNDGDLDLVTNNINAVATLYINSASENKNFLKLKFRQEGHNTFGIGTKAYAWTNGKLHYDQLFTSRGFQSASEPMIHFGLGNHRNVDSIQIVWPDGHFEKLYNIKTNQTLELSQGSDRLKKSFDGELGHGIFSRVDSIPGFDYEHEENSYNDFDRQKLIPYKISDRMPVAEVGDLNNDGLEDIFIGNSRGRAAEIYLQSGEGLEKASISFLAETKNAEITGIEIADFNGDGKNDIFYVTGGGEFNGEYEVLKDAYWTSISGSWEKIQLPEYYSNAAVVKAGDYDLDGDLDIFVGGRAVAGDFGKIPRSFLLENIDGKFQLIENQEIENAGMITDAIWADLDNDNHPELILAGEWMSPKIFKYLDGSFKEIWADEFRYLKGLWRSVNVMDIDYDGDLDILLCNWGENSKIRATAESPVRMYYGDIDGNGTTETILAKENNGEYFTFAGLDELASQMNYLRKKFPDYKKFAGKNIKEIFGNDLQKLTLMEIHTTQSGYLKNQDGKFEFIPFNKNLQFAPINSIFVFRNPENQMETALLAGNYFGVTPYHGAFGAFPGAIIFSEKDIRNTSDLGMDLTGKPVNMLRNIKIGDMNYIIGFLNDAAPVIFKYENIE